MKTILLIEDNDDIRNNTAEILELSNYKVIVAENGKVGIERALEHKPHLIICDIMMPLLDGYGVLHAVHKNEAIKNTPFIFLSAKAERGDFRKGMELGADDYITKPFSGSELLDAVDSRLKKMEELKHEFSPALGGLQNAVHTMTGEDILRLIVEGRSINSYKKKQAVYSEGNHPATLFYILKGKVKAFKINEEGKELVTELYGPGDFLGYISMLEGELYQDTAEAMEDCDIALIPKEDFEELLHNNIEVAEKFIRLLARDISAMEKQLLGLAYNSLRKKVAEALLALHTKYKINTDEKFAININRESLASIAGTATESLIRTLGEFRNEKLIDIKDGNILITNLKKLERLIN